MEDELWRLAELPGGAIGEGAFAPGRAVWVGRREVAHVDADGALDVRLTKAAIRARRAELGADPRVTLRAGTSDWIEVVVGPDDVDFAVAVAVGVVREAVEANRPTAPPGPPPAGSDLERRRRFH